MTARWITRQTPKPQTRYLQREPTSAQSRFLRSLAGGPPYSRENNRQVTARLRNRCFDEGWVDRFGELTDAGHVALRGSHGP